MSEGFVGRWARLKAADRRLKQGGAVPAPPPEPAVALPAAPAPEQAAPEAPAPAVEEEPKAPALPPVESLTRESDFTPFLKEGVPEDVKLAALRKLWRSDPAWAGPEVLDLHNLDYTLPGVPEIVRTAYQAGKGFLDAAAEQAEKAAVPPATGDEAVPPTKPAKDAPDASA
jgi:hypothetical protein